MAGMTCAKGAKKIKGSKPGKQFGMDICLVFPKFEKIISHMGIYTGLIEKCFFNPQKKLKVEIVNVAII
ncbi:MAG: hypothetical protein GXO89_09790 [Chlorobi bacterium]|nr:hypothetical protein [Chlorobiota bacterium]